jgi:hypothetical protein
MLYRRRGCEGGAPRAASQQGRSKLDSCTDSRSAHVLHDKFVQHPGGGACVAPDGCWSWFSRSWDTRHLFGPAVDRSQLGVDWSAGCTVWHPHSQPWLCTSSTQSQTSTSPLLPRGSLAATRLSAPPVKLSIMATATFMLGRHTGQAATQHLGSAGVLASAGCCWGENGDQGNQARVPRFTGVFDCL